jgi:hypothetical protein
MRGAKPVMTQSSPPLTLFWMAQKGATRTLSKPWSTIGCEYAPLANLASIDLGNVFKLHPSPSHTWSHVLSRCANNARIRGSPA